jgi:DNA-binding response OmpR family regulator
VRTDPTAAAAVAVALRLAGLHTTAVLCSEEALSLVNGSYFDVIVLEAEPGHPGIVDVCRTVRRSPLNRHATIIVLAAALPQGDELHGLDVRLIRTDQSDNIVREIGRVAASYTDRGNDGWRPPLFLEDLQIDPARRAIRVRGSSVSVTRQEFELLYLLASHPGLVFSRQRLLSRLWPPGALVTPRSVDAMVARLRQKIERDPSAPTLLLTVWGDGYRIADQ